MLISVDVEADGPVPGLYSMVSFGAVVVEPGLARTFYATLAPISESWVPDALAVSGFTREQTMDFPHPADAIHEFKRWLEKIDRPRFIADNNGFDWAFINYYFHLFIGENPMGWSSSNIASMWQGFNKSATFRSFKHLRQTRHTHNALDDAMGNAEALLTMREMGLHFPIKDKKLNAQ